MYNYNPLQSQYELLNRRKQELDSQMAMIQNQMNQQPPINQTFQITSPQQPVINSQFDFNGKVANGVEEAKKISCNNLPVIIMDANEPKFYMRNLDGSFKTYTFQEYIEPEPVKPVDNNEFEMMKNSINQLQSNFNLLLKQLNNNQQVVQAEEVKQTPKRTGGKKNEQSNNQ